MKYELPPSTTTHILNGCHHHHGIKFWQEYVNVICGFDHFVSSPSMVNMMVFLLAVDIQTIHKSIKFNSIQITITTCFCYCYSSPLNEDIILLDPTVNGIPILYMSPPLRVLISSFVLSRA